MSSASTFAATETRRPSSGSSSSATGYLRAGSSRTTQAAPTSTCEDGTCDNVRAFLSGRHTVYTAGAYAILLHEALHRQGVGIERLTSCLANEAVRWGAERFGFDEAKALRARNLAFAYTRLFGPPLYRMATPNCLALTRRTEWPDHVEPDG